MNKDLEAQLTELGPEYRAVVNRLRRARTADSVRRPYWRVIAAACLLVAVVFAAVLRDSTENTPIVINAAHEYQLAMLHTEEAIQEIIRTQRPDGSWQNDFLTRRNAEALRECPSRDAKIAYKRAIRNLRIRGM